MNFMKKLTKLLLTGILALAGTFGGNYFLNSSNKENSQVQKEFITPANQSLRNFPEKINGAGSIKKYETPGAKYTLIHLKQAHFVIDEQITLERILSEDITILPRIRDAYKNINNCQKDIYSILKELNENQQISDIRSEGITPEHSFKDKVFLREVYFSRLDDLNKKRYFKENIESSFKIMNYLEGYIKSNKPAPNTTMEETLKDYNKAKQEFEKFKYIPGSNFLLAIENKLNILPAETSETYDSGDNIRENTLLKIISESNNALELTVYGADHNFKDNIEEWNKKNPDKKYSLIEITPKNIYSNEK